MIASGEKSENESLSTTIQTFQQVDGKKKKPSFEQELALKDFKSSLCIRGKLHCRFAIQQGGSKLIVNEQEERKALTPMNMNINNKIRIASSIGVGKEWRVVIVKENISERRNGMERLSWRVEEEKEEYKEEEIIGNDSYYIKEGDLEDEDEIGKQDDNRVETKKEKIVICKNCYCCIF